MVDKGEGLKPKGEIRKPRAIVEQFPFPKELVPVSGYGAFMSQGLLDNIMGIVRVGDVQMEHFGFLLGQWYQDPSGLIQWIEITRALPAPAMALVSPLGVEVSGADLGRMVVIADIISASEQTQNLGWYHSHPNLGIFFSGTDGANQARHYPQAHRIGLVVDPVRNLYGAFRGAESVPYELRVLPVPAPGSFTADGWNGPENRIHSYLISDTDSVMREMEEQRLRNTNRSNERPYFKRK